MKSSTATGVVFLSSLLIALALGLLTRDINFWPTDAKAYYFDAAVRLPELAHLSDIHSLMDSASDRVRWLHGKEILILCLSWAQRLLGDTQTLRPFIWLFIFANFCSSILVYLIARRYWGWAVGLICYLAFAGSFWPYQYILFAKHQPLGLVFFLGAFFVLQRSGPRWSGRVMCVLSGALLAAGLFSSTVAPLYVPFYAAGFFVRAWGLGRLKGAGGRIAAGLMDGVAVILGLLSVIVYVNWPDVLHNLQSYLDYVRISGGYNHFYYNQPYLQQWFGTRVVADARGGWPWVGRYFFLSMPVLFPAALAAAGYCLVTLFQGDALVRRLRTTGVLLLSAAPPLMAETARVAQDGGNYFPSILGAVLLVGYASALARERWLAHPGPAAARRAGLAALIFFGAAHCGWNFWLLATDLYPSRMASTFFSRKIQDLGIKQLYTYRQHPHRDHFIPYLNPEIYDQVTIVPVDSLVQARDGYVLVPPITGDSLYVAATSAYTDYDRDDLLNELVASRQLADYVVAAFPTVASSALWLQEEEVLSYRALMLGQDLPVRDLRSQLLLVDGRRLFADIAQHLPRQEFLDDRARMIRSIGRQTRRFIFQGYLGRFPAPRRVQSVLARVFRQGDPRDGLRAFVYRLDDRQPVWVPAGETFFSAPVPAAAVPAADNGEFVPFVLDPPLDLGPGLYLFMIYRTGAPSDEDYFRIYAEQLRFL